MIIDASLPWIFEPHCRYSFEFTPDTLHIDVIPFSDFAYMDARWIGIFAERILARRFVNIHLTPKAQNVYDVIEQCHDSGIERCWEIKTAPRVTSYKGVSLKPSWSQGKNRRFDPDRFHDWLTNQIHGYIIMDLVDWPIVSVFGLLTEWLKLHKCTEGNNPKIKRSLLNTIRTGDLLSEALPVSATHGVCA